jgi:ubiquinone/menaquinone biosynthesis C-methylase UbiE
MQNFKRIWGDYTSEHQQVIIELGPGENKQYSGSLGLDIVQKNSVDYICDLSEGLPFIPDSSVDLVYSSHFLEHIDNLAFMMSEIERVLKPGGKLKSVVPHFSNPYFYSDYTHHSFWGLYTILYFSNDRYFEREVPRYYNTVDFKVKRIFLRFNSPFRLRSIVNRYVIEKIVNMNKYTQELYEDMFTGIFSCEEIHFEVEKRQS